MIDLDKQAQLKSWIEQSNSTVFFGGAGVSTESGIPDFRSTDGLYNQQWDYPPETIISRSFFDANPEEFYRFYRERMIFTDVQPNACHRKLAELESRGKLSAIVTQNIDGLHQAAGSKVVHELHGSVLRNYCMKCGKFYGVEAIANAPEMIPRCECGGIIKPDVVLYEEALDEQVMLDAVRAIQKAELLIIAGTSLVVWPAAGFVREFKGSHLVMINLAPTSFDSAADLLITDPVGQVFDW
jgi:NAD-dependent deacetylase